jgi:hypothetical protein
MKLEVTSVSDKENDSMEVVTQYSGNGRELVAALVVTFVDLAKTNSTDYDLLMQDFELALSTLEEQLEGAKND